MKYLVIICFSVFISIYHANSLKYIHIDSAEIERKGNSLIKAQNVSNHFDISQHKNELLMRAFSHTESTHPSGWRNLWYDGALDALEVLAYYGSKYWQLQLAVSYFNGIHKLERDPYSIGFQKNENMGIRWLLESMGLDDTNLDSEGLRLKAYASDLMKEQAETTRVLLEDLTLSR
jgi:hypothetical protein